MSMPGRKEAGLRRKEKEPLCIMTPVDSALLRGDGAVMGCRESLEGTCDSLPKSYTPSNKYTPDRL